MGSARVRGSDASGMLQGSATPGTRQERIARLGVRAVDRRAVSCYECVLVSHCNGSIITIMRIAFVRQKSSDDAHSEVWPQNPAAGIASYCEYGRVAPKALPYFGDHRLVSIPPMRSRRRERDVGELLVNPRAACVLQRLVLYFRSRVAIDRRSVRWLRRDERE